MFDPNPLQKVFAAYPSIQAVYLFGSTASGRMHAESDIDLAVISDDSDVRRKKLDLLAALIRCGLDNVDLVFPDNRDLVLFCEAVRPNRLIYARAGFDKGAFYSKVIRQYLDFCPYLASQRAAYKKRILYGAG